MTFRVSVTPLDHLTMASSTTQAIAMRVPNDLAVRIRQEAETSGDTVSAVASRLIRQAIADSHATRSRVPE